MSGSVVFKLQVHHQNHLGVLLKHTFLSPATRVLDSVDLEESLAICTSNKFLGAAAAAGPGTTLRKLPSENVQTHIGARACTHTHTCLHIHTYISKTYPPRGPQGETTRSKQVLHGFKDYSPPKRTMTPGTNSWFQCWGRVSTRCSWNIFLWKKVRKCSNNVRELSKGQKSSWKELPVAGSGIIWASK